MSEFAQYPVRSGGGGGGTITGSGASPQIAVFTGTTAIGGSAGLTFSANTLSTVNLTLSGLLTAANGSSAAPSITFASAPTSGLYEAGGTSFGLAANGVAMGIIGSSGIKLQASSATPLSLGVAVGDSHLIQLYEDGSDSFVINNSETDGSISLLTNSLKALYVSRYQSVVSGSGSLLSPSATDGFFYNPMASAAPTGVPTTFTGSSAQVYNNVNGNLYSYTPVPASAFDPDPNIFYLAKTAGPSGNAITVLYNDDGTNPATVNVVGTAITINYDGFYNGGTFNVGQMVSLFQSTPAVTALVDVVLVGNPINLTQQTSPIALSGGTTAWELVNGNAFIPMDGAIYPVDLNNQSLSDINNLSVNGGVNVANYLQVYGTVSFQMGLNLNDTLSIVTGGANIVGTTSITGGDLQLSSNLVWPTDGSGSIGYSSGLFRPQQVFIQEALELGGISTATRNALPNLAAGAIVFNSDTNKHQAYDGTTWHDLY
jgi:hypothetical protein